MKVFHCQNCEQTVFFENTNCNNCGHALAFLPDTGELAALAPLPDGIWSSLAPASQGRQYRLCGNYTQHQVCNWAIPAEQADTLCVSCRLTRVLPNLEIDGNLEAWRILESAKRRLVYSLLDLKLPLTSRLEAPEQGLAFDFLSDELAASGPVLTGHDEGLITINLAEADDVEREKRRQSLHEPYRTVLGHFRHEVGHYYWDRLIRDAGKIDECRAVFGDESADYAEALKKHYEAPAPDWADTFVSAYASSHPWEDWAETWAHYMHMVDSLDTAAACGMSLQPQRDDEPVLEPLPDMAAERRRSFDRMIRDWLALTYALNNLSRSLGQRDSYPFVLPAPAVEKLRFVHEIVSTQVAGAAAPAPASAPELQPAAQPQPAPVPLDA